MNENRIIQLWPAKVRRRGRPALEVIVPGPLPSPSGVGEGLVIEVTPPPGGGPVRLAVYPWTPRPGESIPDDALRLNGLCVLIRHAPGPDRGEGP